MKFWEIVPLMRQGYYASRGNKDETWYIKDGSMFVRIDNNLELNLKDCKDLNYIRDAILSDDWEVPNAGLELKKTEQW